MIPLEVYSNGYIKSKSANRKVIVLDLDETIGSFGELYLLWSIGLPSDIERNQKTFDDLLDIYPEFLRYGILNIIDYLKYKKDNGSYFKTFIYTNNVLREEWVQMIVNYIENKQTSSGLFDKIIPAFNKTIQCMRTTRDKTHRDFIHCAVIPRTTEICFIDDVYFDKMDYHTVYYIQPKRYHHMMKTSDIVERFANSKFTDPLNRMDVRDLLYQTFIQNGLLNTTGKNISEVNVDIIVSKKIMYHIKEFFLMSVRKSKTRKRRDSTIGRFTRRKL
jgi:hypothetical protein